MNILFVAGKTGGHILPAVTRAHAEKEKGNKTIFVTTRLPLDARIIDEYAHIDVHETVGIGTRPYGGVMGIIRCVIDTLFACMRSFLLLRKYRPAQVISTGGLIAIPVCFAAWVLRIPIIVYELNAVPGRAVRVLAWWATEMRVCFAQSQRFFKKSTVVHYPVRFSDSLISKQEARRLLGLEQDRWTIFISGGSQGSHFINTTIMKLLKDRTRVQIIHQTGAHDITTLTDWYKNAGISAIVFVYRTDIELCYRAADRAIARAGAGSLFEHLFFKVPVLIIPLIAKSTDHQCDNAYAMQKMHPELFMVRLQKQFDQEEFDKQKASLENFLFE